MKAKLAAVREALKYQQNMAINGMASHRDCIAGSCVQALALLDEVLAELESEALVERVADAQFKAAIDFEYKPSPNNLYDSRCVYKAQAQAAINSIKGE